MYIENKRCSIMTGNSTMEYPPKFYVDFWRIKASLKRMWKDNNIFHFEFGIFGFYFQLELYYNFLERPRTEKEEESYQKYNKFLESLNER